MKINARPSESSTAEMAAWGLLNFWRCNGKQTSSLRPPIGNPKFGLFTLLHGQNSSSPCIAISAMLDSKGRAFVLIQAPPLAQPFAVATFVMCGRPAAVAASFDNREPESKQMLDP